MERQKIVSLGDEVDSPSPAVVPTADAVGGPPVARGKSAVGTSAEQVARPTPAPGLALPASGTQIGQYEIIRELGRGGMGAVFLARDTKLGRRVAIKFLQSEQPDITARFLLEARATAQCNHENIVVIHEVGEHEGDPFMVLEYMQGAALDEQIRRGGKLPVRRAVEIIVSVARALSRAHEHGIVHRDLKPGNIFITDSGTVKVLDFGIAKLIHGDEEDVAQNQQALAEFMSQLSTSETGSLHLDQDTGSGTGTGAGTGGTDLTREGALVGTLPYMSPEQWGAGTVDHRTDIWAAGILLYRMVTGKHPLAPLKGRRLMVTGVVSQPMPSARGVSPDMPDELADIIDRCLIKYKEQRMSSARELLIALEQLLPRHLGRQRQIHEAPYAGLSAFQESDADRFFGRSQEIIAAVTKLRDRPLLGILGPSGVGKSSFVRAGIVPALKESGEDWASFVARPGRQPVGSLAELIAPMVSKSATTVAGDLSELHEVHQRLYTEPGFVGTVLRSRARRKQQKILLFIDQFEELYTLVSNEHERRAFTACLASVADDATSPLRVVISLRSDFLDRVPEDGHFMSELTQGLFFLMPPGSDALREALILPAELAGYQFENASMVDHMLDHLAHTPGALPLLQFSAAKLWEMRDQTRRLITEDSYQHIGGIAGALASHADSVVAELPPQGQALARSIFLRLVTPDRTRAIVSLGELNELSRQPDEVQRLLDQLVHARLLVVQIGSGGASVEIVHESLIHSWPVLGRWLDENQDDAAFLDQLRTASRQWYVKGRPSGLLWRGETMHEARRWHKRYRGDLTEVEQSYLTAVFALGERMARRKRYAVIGVIGFLSLLVAVGAVALVLIRDAQQEATEQARQVKAQLAMVQAAEHERAKAVNTAQQAREVATQATKEVGDTKEELRQRNVQLQSALDQAEADREFAEQAEAQAEAARKLALRKGAIARKAKDEALEANAQLKVLLAQERARVERLKKMGGMIIETVPIKKKKQK